MNSLPSRPLLLCTVLLCVSLLAGCGRQSLSQDRLANPLYAEWYYDDLVQSMVNLEIRQDPAIEDPAKKAAIEEIRRKSLTSAQEAVAEQRKGFTGHFANALEETQGEVLVLASALYLDPAFITVPGVELHVYLSLALDPRDEPSFPDPSAVDVGPLVSPYGEQALAMPALEDLSDVRTVVLYDRILGRIHGFAQIGKAI